MLRITRNLATIPGLTMLTIVWASLCTMAEDFRVESRVFQGHDEQPQSTTTTIFSTGRVYDFQAKPHEVTVFDLPAQQIRLLDLTRQVHTVLKVEQLDRFTLELQKRAEHATEPGLRFLLQPQFTMQRGNNANERVFQSEYVTYQVETFAPRTPIVATQYREFCDLSAKLNALLNRGWPPFARLQVNSALVEEQLLPTKVNLLFPNKSTLGQRQSHFRSEHDLHVRLTEADQQRVVQVADAISQTKPVTLAEYLGRK